MRSEVKRRGPVLVSWATSSRQDTRFNLCGCGPIERPSDVLTYVTMVIEWQERKTGCRAPDDLALSVSPV
jgi:hypothetical protein